MQSAFVKRYFIKNLHCPPKSQTPDLLKKLSFHSFEKVQEIKLGSSCFAMFGSSPPAKQEAVLLHNSMVWIYLVSNTASESSPWEIPQVFIVIIEVSCPNPKQVSRFPL